MTTFSSMSLYSLTLQPPSSTVQAVTGDYVGSGREQILCASGSRISIVQISRKRGGAVIELFSEDMFAIVRSIAKFRITGVTKDYIAITTDSGRFVSFEFLQTTHKLRLIHEETYGKSGVRRVIPGEYLAADPSGRAVMLASIEKNRIAYLLQRAGRSDVTISSPLEAHRPQSLMYCLVALDQGVDNPVFASIEANYGRIDAESPPGTDATVDKHIMYYELDMGLNHVVDRGFEKVDRTSNILFAVPGGHRYPGGVLCCGEDSITYLSMQRINATRKRVAIPRREGPTEDPNRKRHIIGGAVLKRGKTGKFFFLLQSEDGDLFKVSLDSVKSRSFEGVETPEVDRIRIKYFDTIPVASSICVLKDGFVYCASESGDRAVYDMVSLGEDTEDPEYDSTQFPLDTNEDFSVPFFTPRPLQNLSAVDAVPSQNPIMDMDVADMTRNEAPQIYTVCGSGARSTFRVTKNAMAVLEAIDTPLPEPATEIWTARLTSEDEFDTLIVLSLISGSTLLLRVGEDNVDEAGSIGLLTETTTLGVQQFGEDCVLQVHPRGIRQVQGIEYNLDEKDQVVATHGRITDWACPPHRTIVACATNTRQVTIALSSGDILHFEAAAHGLLAKSETQIHLDDTVTCLALPEVPEGKTRASFLAVGVGDQTVRVYNLIPDHEGQVLQEVSLQATSAPATAVAICNMRDRSPQGYGMYLHIGLRSGVYIRTVIDEHNGELRGAQARSLGHIAIKLARVFAAGEPAVIAMGARCHISYAHPQTQNLSTTPLSGAHFTSSFNFSGPSFKGIIAMKSSELRIFQINDLTKKLSENSIPLQYTPRKLVRDPYNELYYVVQSDNNTMPHKTRQELSAKDVNGDVSMNGEQGMGELPATEFGYPRMLGSWASCIQVIDPIAMQVTCTIELEDNKCALSAAAFSFDSQPDTFFLAVGVAKDLIFSPFHFTSGGVRLYKLTSRSTLEFLHETPLDSPPLALLPFKGKLLTGDGRNLTLFDYGTKSLLRKARARNCVPARIQDLKTQGSRIVVADQAESVTYVVHKEQAHPQLLIPFADDTVTRHTTSIDMLDYNTVAGGDKFGNVWLLRCPKEVSDAADESNDGQHLLQSKKFLSGTPNRLDLVAHYYVNDIPKAIQKTSLVTGGEQIIVWAGLQGTLGTFLPITSRRYFKMFQQLELAMRLKHKPISGRDHLAYRSYYNPVKAVIDGDLVERFLLLSRDDRERIVAEIDVGGARLDVDDVEAQIWLMRSYYAF
ncbi:hypothetical protein P154DRAFT_578032 [Amniculicola lignicola CBS 123094]|uniref:Pre-mRNA-splicing factor rse1 n=1 Tax=Amniculicola lignicola CBS 123094 TaxID=1392246 RepID=A0A6A5W9U0_9PLEO|nr:hypothetical protein P154DRAFT_578032 [Amniculicola lignicola CBS 123094]